MIVLHVGHVTPLPAPLWLAIGVGTGLLATLVMNAPMATLSEGYTPAVIAASVLFQTLPSAVSRRRAVGVHHAAGPLAGLLYAGFGVVLDSLFPPVSRIAGLSLSAHLAAVVLVTGFIYALFAFVVLPRYGGAARDRLPTVRRHWLVSALVFGVSMAVVVPQLTIWLR